MPAPYTTLQNIYIIIRRLVRAPSNAQLTNDELNDYINRFYMYDMPQHLRIFDLKRTFTFYTRPYIGDYTTDLVDPTSALYEFKNKYVSVHEPLYIAGMRRMLSQSREQFFNIYPNISQIGQTGLFGDGVTVNFAGTLPTGNVPAGVPVMQNNVLFNSIGPNYYGLELHDIPTDANTGILDGDTGAGLNTINYITGAYNLSFSAAPLAGQPINFQVVPYQAAMPQVVLFYNDTFTVRPIPDQVYPITFDVFVVPTELLSTDTTQHPDINQWFQYIAYGAARKILQERLDMESVALLEPEYHKQELLCLRKTNMQLSNQRVATVYTEGSANWPYGGWGFFNSPY